MSTVAFGSPCISENTNTSTCYIMLYEEASHSDNY